MSNWLLCLLYGSVLYPPSSCYKAGEICVGIQVGAICYDAALPFLIRVGTLAWEVCSLCLGTNRPSSSSRQSI